MRALVVLVVLVPTLAMVAALGGSIGAAWADREAAQDLEQEVARLVAIVDARAAVADEELATSVIAAAAAYGVDVQRLEDLYGIDYEAQLDEARAVVDQDETFAASAPLRSEREALLGLRSRVDVGEADLDEVSQVMVRLKGELDQLWEARRARFERSDAFSSLPAASRADLEVLEETYVLLRTANQRAELARVLLTREAAQGEVADLLVADGAFEALADELVGRFDRQASEAWASFEADEGAQAFEQTIADAAEVGLAGATPPLRDDGVAFGQAFAGGAPWAQHLTDLVRAAAEDMAAQARADEQAATNTVVLRTVVAAGLAILSLVAAGLLARMVVRPVRLLGEAAREVRDGRFAPGPLEVRGPREVADTAEAFNEMAGTLAAVEAQAVVLAEDPSGAEEPEPPPGRTGAALHAAIERLRASLLEGERQRAELHELATHDQLTGLLNRAAATEALARDLAGQDRHGRRTMVLFVDLDGLKQLNDVHGHEAGDAALVLVAEALRATTRASDAVARYGGDEFLVVGSVEETAEVEALAERIRRRISTSELVWQDERLSISCSIGMAVSRSGEQVPDALVRRADAALYDAKRGGRDRAEWAALAVP